MSDSEDMIEVTPPQGGVDNTAAGPRRKFLSVWFRCCHTYGRMYRNKEQTAYEGRCPKCAAPVHATIGSEGTNRRMFEAR